MARVDALCIWPNIFNPTPQSTCSPMVLCPSVRASAGGLWGLPRSLADLAPTSVHIPVNQEDDVLCVSGWQISHFNAEISSPYQSTDSALVHCMQRL